MYFSLISAFFSFDVCRFVMEVVCSRRAAYDSGNSKMKLSIFPPPLLLFPSLLNMVDVQLLSVKRSFRNQHDGVRPLYMPLLISRVIDDRRGGRYMASCMSR